MGSKERQIIEGVLQGGPWREAPWDERSRRFGGTFLQGLRDTLSGQSVLSAVGSAWSAARGDVPLAAGVLHEIWGRAVLVWACRELVREAHTQTDPALRKSLLQTAAELAGAAAQMTVEGGAGPGNQPPFEAMVDAARDALVRVRAEVDLSLDEGPFLAAYVHQLRHIASLLAVGGHSVDGLVRGAITRTDRSARKDVMREWVRSPVPTREQWVQAGLAEAAWGMCLQVSRELARGEASREVALWLARTACALASRVDRVGPWVPRMPGEDEGAEARPEKAEEKVMAVKATTAAVGEARPGEARVRTEAKMDKTNPILKTLETDAGDAAWRLAGSQFVKLTRDPIIALLSRHLAPDDESMRLRVAAFLDTELGNALLSSVLSAALSAMPNVGNDVPQRLARELRVKAMAGTADVVADVLMGPLRQVMMLYLQGVPTESAQPAGLPAPEPAVKAADAAAVTDAVPSNRTP
ncbi:MAG: hypothetical protein HY909_26045 [Deltaproteobacteria bacterium]|nr:hypothetical protein [Deltaproteobacteria bacterium]